MIFTPTTSSAEGYSCGHAADVFQLSVLLPEDIRGRIFLWTEFNQKPDAAVVNDAFKSDTSDFSFNDIISS